MDTTTNQWPQGICLVKPLRHESSKSSSASAAVGGGGGGGLVERKARPQKEQALNCPRCNSTNTKFCYYNNYSLSQPRYFCKTCRRYWTEGGTLRNVPVGGGSRKNKRSTSSSSSPKKLPDLTIFSSQPTSHQNPNNKIHLLQLQGRQDLNLPQHHPPPLGVDGLLHFPFTTDTTSKTLHDSTNLPAALELLKAAGISSSGGSSLISSLNLMSSSTTTMPPPPVVSDSNNSIYYYYSSHDDEDHHHRDDDDQMKQQPPAKLFNFSSLHHDHDHHGFNVVENNGYHEEEPAPVVQDTNSARRLFLPYEELKPVSTATDQYHHQENKVQGESNGYWNGMLGGGGGGSSW